MWSMKKEKDIQETAKKEKMDLQVEVGEDASKYGEFISSYFAWISLAKQKERAEHLEEVTKENNKNK